MNTFGLRAACLRGEILEARCIPVAGEFVWFPESNAARPAAGSYEWADADNWMVVNDPILGSGPAVRYPGENNETGDTVRFDGVVKGSARNDKICILDADDLKIS